MSYRLGVHCHWCGEDLGARNDPKTGKHLFCGDACKMAHHRAYHRWLRNRVTLGSGPGIDRGDLVSSKRNEIDADQVRTSSSRSRRQGSSKGNSRKGGK